MAMPEDAGNSSGTPSPNGVMCYYESPCEGLIDFKILGPSGSEEGVEHLDYRNAKGQEERVDIMAEGVQAADDSKEKPTTQQDHHPEQEKKKQTMVDAGASGRKKKRNRNSDFYGSEIFNSGEVTQPVNPYFVTIAHRTRVNELYFPADIVRCYDLELPETLAVVDSTGRRFQMKRRKWKDGRVVFYGGWKAVCKVNLVQENDRIICELITGEGGNLELKGQHVACRRSILSFPRKNSWELYFNFAHGGRQGRGRCGARIL